SLLGMLAPVGSLLTRAPHAPRATWRLFCRSLVPYVSLAIVSAVSVASYLATRRAVFVATGDDAGQRGTPAGRWWHAPAANSRVVFGLEAVVGAALTVAAVTTMNIALLTISTSLLLSPPLHRLG